MPQFGALILDFDSTIIKEESLEVLFSLSLESSDRREEILRKIKAITNRGMEGSISIEDSLRERLALLMATRDQVARAGKLCSQSITESFLRNKAFLENPGNNIYIISAGFEEIILPTTATLGISHQNVFANAFTYDTDGIVTGLDQKRLTSHNKGKVKQVKALSLPRPVVMVGDGFSDYEVKQYGAADVFIAYAEHARRDNVVAHADYVATSFDDIKHYLGTLS